MGTWTHEQQYAPAGMDSHAAPGYAGPHPAAAVPQQQYFSPEQQQYALAQQQQQQQFALAQQQLGLAPQQYASTQHQPVYAQPQGHQQYGFPTVGGGMHALNSPAMRIVGYRRRIRWENIVPTMAVAAFIIAGVLFSQGFDQIFQRGKYAPAAQVSASAAGASVKKKTPADGAMSSADIALKLDQASQLMQRGDYAAAGMILHPMMELASREPKIGTMHEELDRREALNTTLTAKLERQVASSRWPAALKTLQQIEQLMPLTPQQLELRTTAQTAGATAAAAAAKPKAAEAALAKARRMFANGRKLEARAYLVSTLKQHDTPALRALLAQINASIVPVTATRTPPGVAGAGAGGGGGPATAPPSSSSPGGAAPKPPGTPAATPGVISSPMGGTQPVAADSHDHVHPAPAG